MILMTGEDVQCFNSSSFFQGYLYIYLSGYSPERFLNLCGRKNIVLWDLQWEQEGYRFFYQPEGICPDRTPA